MVGEAGRAFWQLASLVAEQPLWYRLEPEDRVRVLAALAALLILGFALIAFAWWAGRFTRRYMAGPSRGSRRESSRRPSEDDWASKRLVPDDQEPPEDD